MAQYKILVEDTTPAGAELIKKAEQLAQASQTTVKVSRLDKPLTAAAKSIDDGLKELKLILTGKKKGIPFEDFIKALEAEES